MSLPTPNYILNKQVTIHLGIKGNIIFPEGTFVRPIEVTYLPSHITEDKEFKDFDPDKEVYCYTPKGIKRLLKDCVRKI